MKGDVYTVLLILISVFEMWMCWQVLYWTVLEKQDLKNCQRAFIWANIIGLGILLGINREIIYFSNIMFIFSVLVTVLCVFLIKKKQFLFIIETTIWYLAGIASLDFFFAFISMTIFETDFYQFIYYTPSKPGAQIILLLFSRGSVFIVFRKIWKRQRINLEEWKSWLAVGCILLCVLLRGYQFLLYDMATGIKDMHGWSAAVSMLGIFIITGGIWGFIYRFKMMEKENQTLLVKEEMMRQNQMEMKALMDQNQILIHDIKNYLLTLRCYAKEKDWEKLNRYLDELCEEFRTNKIVSWTHIQMLDMLLAQKKQEAEKEQIEVYIEETVLGNLPFMEREICSMFGNLLDNAIEACQKVQGKKRWIKIRTNKQKNMLCIVIENSIDKKPIEKNGELISEKEDKRIHGYGLKSVKRIVEKYRGTFQYEIQEDFFNIKIIFFNLTYN